jgi:hypothetical protein
MNYGVHVVDGVLVVLLMVWYITFSPVGLMLFGEVK